MPARLTSSPYRHRSQVSSRFAGFLTFRILTILFVAAMVTAGSGSLYCYKLLNAPIDVTPDQTYLVVSGSSLHGITHDLVEIGIVKMPPWMFRYYGLLTMSRGHLQAGEYNISSAHSAVELLSLLRSGNVVQHEITFLEGWKFSDWRRVLDGESAIEHHISHLADSSIMALLEKPRMSPEGWFFPDTYQFRRGESDLDILRRAHRKMIRILDENWPGRTVGSIVEKPYHILVLASMIEKETGMDDDRGKISRVFVNRLEQNIKLQSDPTVIYGLGNLYEGNLTRQHLRDDTAYNTYVHRGLPPTPIAMPGLASIQAALHPEPGDYFYFVARGDGASYFSLTLAEHNAAVERYQKSGRSKDYRSRAQ